MPALNFPKQTFLFIKAVVWFGGFAVPSLTEKEEKPLTQVPKRSLSLLLGKSAYSFPGCPESKLRIQDLLKLMKIAMWNISASPLAYNQK